MEIKMIAENLFAKIRKTKGPICAAFTNFDDAFYVQVSKKDLLVQLSARFKLTEETGFELDDNGYLDKDYSQRA
jgi:hypothetical protein